jgi:hypothetical protein
METIALLTAGLVGWASGVVTLFLVACFAPTPVRKEEEARRQRIGFRAQ